MFYERIHKTRKRCIPPFSSRLEKKCKFIGICKAEIAYIHLCMYFRKTTLQRKHTAAYILRYLSVSLEILHRVLYCSFFFPRLYVSCVIFLHSCNSSHHLLQSPILCGTGMTWYHITIEYILV